MFCSVAAVAKRGTMKSTEGLYLERVDHLRGWAAMLVLVYHSIGDLSGGASHAYPSNPLMAFISDGHTGVSMFLVLSGFILTIINRDVFSGAKLGYASFIFNRFVRIFPLLIFVTAIAIATKIPTFKSTDLLPLLTLQLYAADSIGISSEWAVGLEFQCYLLFPVLLLALKANGLRYLLAFIVLMVIVRLMLNITMLTHNGSYYFVLLGRIDQFIVGMGTAVIYLRIRERSFEMWQSIAAITAGLCGIMLLLRYGNSIGGGTAMYGAGDIYPAVFHLSEALLWALVVLGYLLMPIRKVWLTPAWSKLGEVSFSLYLLHPLVTLAVAKTAYPYLLWALRGADGLVAPAVATAVFVIPASVAIAILSYYVIEKPGFALRRKYLDREGMPARQSTEPDRVKPHLIW